MINKVLSALSVMTLLALGACSSSDAPQTGDDQEVNGKKCGGFAGITCPVGQTCKIVQNHPDAMGTCKVITAGTEGGACRAAASSPCDGTLECKNGKCVKAQAPDVGEGGGEQCGGFAGLPCKTGFVCQVPQECCDRMGTCVRRN